MSEDRTNKDPLLGGLDGMRAGQTWEGAPESAQAGSFLGFPGHLFSFMQ